MTQKDNILQELNELKSTLADLDRQQLYAVPSGYFDGLAAQVLNRIKEMDSSSVSEELNSLSPLLGKISRQVPYAVPTNYFDGLAERILFIVKQTNQSAKEELETISPFLSGLKKENPFSVPQGYFENLAKGIAAEENNQPAKVVSFGHRSLGAGGLVKRKWFRYAAAAMVVGVIALVGIRLIIGAKRIDPRKDPEGWVANNVMKNVDSKDIDAFVTLAGESPETQAVAVTPVNPVEVKELMKDVSDKEIQDFLNDTEGATDSNTGDAETMTN